MEEAFNRFNLFNRFYTSTLLKDREKKGIPDNRRVEGQGR